jgi:hypothetical protein
MAAKLRKILSLALTISLIFQQVRFASIATELNISGYRSRMGSNLAVEKFRPLHLRYFSYDALNDNFKVLVDKGDAYKGLSPKGTVPEARLQSETQTLLSYFLVGLTLPDSMFWVNLRPDSEGQVIDQYLEKTDVGRIMLEADLQLKKDTASFTSPATPEGRVYWDKLYKKAAELYGYDNVTIPTLTRPWIVPGEIIIRESQDSAYVYKANLKVMLEQDYLKDSATYNFKDARSKALNEYSSQLIRELIIPKLTREVNSSKRYAPLRQVYYSLILAQWFKARNKGLPNLIDARDLTNLISKESWTKTDYFKQYQKSFSQGEYNIQEPVRTPTGQVIRSYFSGGMKFNNITSSSMVIIPASQTASLVAKNLIAVPTISSPMGAAPAASSPVEEKSASSAVEEERQSASLLMAGINKAYESLNGTTIQVGKNEKYTINIVDNNSEGMVINKIVYIKQAKIGLSRPPVIAEYSFRYDISKVRMSNARVSQDYRGKLITVALLRLFTKNINILLPIGTELTLWNIKHDKSRDKLE